MKEEERKKIVDKIKKELDEKESLRKKYEKLKKLTNDPKVAEYLYLLEDIDRIESNIERYRNPISGDVEDSLDERIQFRFRCTHFSCNHKVWIYAGSFYIYENFDGEEDFLRYDSEDLSDNLKSFSYNKYICLECQKEIDIPKTEWKKFEESNLVLKANQYVYTEPYHNLYYKLLYNNYSFDDAQNAVIDQFNKDNKNKVLSKKKNMSF